MYKRQALGRSYGAFDDKLVIETVDGDSALEKILARAQKAKVTLIDIEGVE